MYFTSRRPTWRSAHEDHIRLAIKIAVVVFVLLFIYLSIGGWYGQTVTWDAKSATRLYGTEYCYQWQNNTPFFVSVECGPKDHRVYAPYSDWFWSMEKSAWFRN